MTSLTHLRAWCRRMCVRVMTEGALAVRAIRGSWWLFLAMIVAIFSWVGWMHEREDKLHRLAVLEADLIEYRESSTLTKERILDAVRENRATLQSLLEAQRVGPRHTACDTKQILDDLRSQGVRLPAYPVEDRCK